MELVQVLQYLWGPLTKLHVCLGVEGSSTLFKRYQTGGILVPCGVTQRDWQRLK